MATYVTKDTLIGEIVREYPESIDILFEMGMHCFGCPAAQAESLEDACAVHGIEVEKIVGDINKAIAEERE
jgi:hybrid cluster-associated redox disulfide protein